MTSPQSTGSPAAESLASITAEIATVGLEDALDRVNEEFYAYDAGGRLLRMNRAAREIFHRTGLDPDAAIGRTFSELFPTLRGTPIHVAMQRCAADRTPVTMEHAGPFSNRWVEIRFYPAAAGVAVYIRDISARRRVERAQQLLADAGAVLASSLELDQTLATVAELVVPALADWFSLQLYDDREVLRPTLTKHTDPSKRVLADYYNRRWPPESQQDGAAAVVARTGESQMASDITDEMLQAAALDPEHLDVIRALGMSSVIIVPLVARDRHFGAMSLVAAESGRHYDNQDLLLAEELARRIAVAIDNARLFNEARGAADRTARLQALTAGLSRALTPEDVADTVVREGMAAYQARDGILCLLASDGEWLEIVRADGLPEATANEFRRFRVSDPYPLSEAIRLREPLFFESKAAMQARYPELREANKRALTESWIALPLLADDRPIGGVAFGFTEARELSAADRAFGIALAQQCALALERARLFASEQRARAAAERLQILTAALSEASTRAAVGEVVMRHGVTAVGAWGGVLALLTEDGAELELFASTGYPPEACMGVGRRWSLIASIPIAEATRTGEPVIVESPADWGRRYVGGHAPTPGMSKAWAAIPIQLGGATSGALLWTYDRERTFDDDERSLMTAVARQCSLALERARSQEAERQARQEAELARERADAANQTKTEFLAVMSHELRTPLNAIAGYADLLDVEVHGPLTPAQHDAVSRIQRSQRHLLGLINDVLNFARLEAGQVSIDLEPVRVATVIASIQTLVAPQLATKGHHYRFEECDESLTALADTERLQQILLNLVSNAIKFTPAGGSITVACASEASRVTIRVSDTGPGIPADKLDSIFEPFVQLDTRRTRVHEGVGLGLAISRDLARAMGGDLTVRSTPGIGTTFTLSLRAAED